MEERNTLSIEDLTNIRFFLEDVTQFISNLGEDAEAGNTHGENKFVKMFKLEEFECFNPKCKDKCLTSTEYSILLYLLNHHLRYIQRSAKYHYGNFIKMDKTSKKIMMEKLGVSQRTYERLLKKLCDADVFRKISKDFYQVNPYCFARGETADVVKAREKLEFPSETGMHLSLTNKQKEMVESLKKLSGIIDEEIAAERETKKMQIANEAAMLKKEYDNLNVKEIGELFEKVFGESA